MSYKIREISEYDIMEVISISDNNLGKGYIKEELLYEIISNKNKYISYIAIKRVSNTAVGFIFGTINNKEKTAILKTIAVDIKFQSKGVGSILVNYFLAESNLLNISSIKCIVWKSLNNIPIENLLLNKGFIKAEEIKEYWKEDSLEQGFICPNCGTVCLCSAIIYNKI